MNKQQAIAAVIAAFADSPIIFTTGYACRVARGIADRPNHFYMAGSMGLASSIAIGVALQTTRRTIVVDGDGAVLMNPVGLLAAGALPDLPLLHVVLDDGQYASTGGQAVPSDRADLGALARACGYPTVHDTDRLDHLTATLDQERDPTGPVFIRAVIDGPEPPVPDRIDNDVARYARRFEVYCAGRR